MTGQAISRTTVAALFLVLGTTYGVGDRATTFNLPDTRGFVVAAPDAGAGRINLTSCTGTLPSSCGSQTIVVNNLPNSGVGFTANTIASTTAVLHDGSGHNIDALTNNSSADGGTLVSVINNPGNVNIFRAATSTGSGGVTIPSITASGTTNPLGSGTAFVQPTYILNRCIKQ